MEAIISRKRQQEEEICIHVIQRTEEPEVDEQDGDFRFDIAPFRQTFFRYSMYGQSKVVRSSSFVYASHHSSTSAWLEIRKLSVALVGNSEVPNLALFSPTVKEIHFMGHITYPATAFKLLPQLTSLEKVSFNIGFGGYINEFHESPEEEFPNALPEVATVTSLEIKINHQLYRSCTEAIRHTFDRIIQSVMTHSAESFPNLRSISVDIPDRTFFSDKAELLLDRGNLRRSFEVKTAERKIQIRPKPLMQNAASLPFDPCARIPTYSQYNSLRRIDACGFPFQF